MLVLATLKENVTEYVMIHKAFLYRAKTCLLNIVSKYQHDLMLASTYVIKWLTDYKTEKGWLLWVM